jgi:hypothetical protein
MSDASPPASATLSRLLAWAGAAGLVGLTIVVYLVDGGPWPPATTIRGLIVASAGATIAWGLARPRPTRALLPYAGYALALLVVWMANPNQEATRELWRQAAFLAVLAAAAAPLPIGHGGLVGLHVGALLLVAIQLTGPRSGFDHLGRAGFYHAVDHWSGYPELGLLMAVGACGLVAIACAARPVAVRLAAAAVAAVFAGATIFLQSRSAVVTVPVVAFWLLGVAAVKWRSKAAVALLVLGLVGAGAFAVRAGGVSALAARAAGTLARETAIREQGWLAARAMAAEHPIAGVGLGNYAREYVDRRFGIDRLGIDRAHAYNIVLHVLAESGAIGLIGWLALWGRVLWVGVRRAAPTPRGAAIFALHGMLVAFLVRSQSEHFLANLVTSDRVLFLVALWMGLTEALALDAARVPAPPRAQRGE